MYNAYELLMIKRVLVPMNDSEMAERALRYALEVHPDAELTVLTVVGEPSGMLGGAAAVALADECRNQYSCRDGTPRTGDSQSRRRIRYCRDRESCWDAG